MLRKRKILLKSAKHSREGCPISLFLKEKIDKVRLIERENDKEVACQIEKDEKGSFLFWIIENLTVGEEKTYTLITGERDISSKKPGVELFQSEEKIKIEVSGQHFSSYHYRNVVRPYLWPIVRKERSLTRAPETLENEEAFDHIHHRSCWIAHGDVNGIDNWSEEKGHGYQIHQAFKEIVSGPIFGKIKAKNYWTDEEKKKVLEEERIIKVYNLITSRIIDFEINFQATEGNIKFGDTKEGGILSVRVNPLINADKSGLIENAYGAINEEETWGKRAPWCDYSGSIKREKVGLAILEQPTNFRYPTYWHVRNYGLMTANPFGLSYYYNDAGRDGSYILPSDENLIFRYRLFIHSGNAQEGKVAEAYHNYINPPKVLMI